MGGEISESYLTLRLGRELGTKAKEVAEKAFSRPVLVYADLSLTHAYQDQKLGTVPSYFEILKTRPEVFLDKRTYQFFQLVFFYDLDESNKAQEVEKIYTFMNELQKMCAPGTENKFAIDYFPPDFAPEAQKAIARIGLKGFTHVENGHWTFREYSKSGQRKDYLFLSKQEIAGIKEPADIIKYFRK